MCKREKVRRIVYFLQETMQARGLYSKILKLLKERNDYFRVLYQMKILFQRRR